MTNTLKLIGERLRAAREQAGLSLSEAAKTAGIARSYLHQLEHAESEPGITKLHALARVYNRPLAWFTDPLDEPGEPTPLQQQLLAITAGMPTEDIDEIILYADYLRYRRNRIP